MECFICVSESMERYMSTSEVITQYKGTLLCSTHAKDVYKKVMLDFVRPLEETILDREIKLKEK